MINVFINRLHLAVNNNNNNIIMMNSEYFS